MAISLPAIVMTLIYLISTCLLIVITVYDIKHKIIPDSLVYTFDSLALISVFIGGISIIHAPHLWTLLAGPILALPFALIWLCSKGTWMGLGDAKLVLGLGWLLGLNGGANAVILAFWIGAAVSLIWMFATYRRFKARLEIPFGPYLILGLYIMLIWHMQVLDFRMLAGLF
jgi:leader peptidase (prepilin peptidase)/N-methyltransferase